MKKIIVMFFLFSVLIINQLSAMTYTEDNAAYWYKKAFEELINDLPNKELLSLDKINSVEDYKKNVSDSLQKAIADKFQNYISGIKKAKSLNKCIFWEKFTNEAEVEKNQFNEARLFRTAFAATDLMAWYAISINKPDIAGALWQMVLSISANIGEHNICLFRFICANWIRRVIINLDGYCKNGASPEFKAKFCSYFKNKWSQSIFDIKDVINLEFDFWKSNLEYLANNQKGLARYFGAKNTPDKPVLTENQICKGRLKIITGAIEMYAMDSEDVKFSDYNNCIEKLTELRYLKANNDYSCPENGVRTVKQVKEGNDLVYTVSCSCVKEIVADDFAEDSKPMQLAKQYRATFFDKEKEDIYKYFEIIKNYDHSKPLSEELKKETQAMDEKFINGVLPPYAIMKYYSTRESFERISNEINAFLKTHDAK